MKRPFILDIDTSFDSMSAAYIAASAYGSKLACITTVFGCFSDVETATSHALQAVALAKAKVKVYSGCAQPMAKKLSFGRDMHVLEHRRENIITGQNIKCAPVVVEQAEKSHAVTELMRLLRKGDQKYDIVLLGPATNLACALRIDATIAKNIGVLYVRAGAIHCADVTQYAEKNAWSDPEALQIVTHCGCDVVMLPLDTALASTLSIGFMDRLEGAKDPKGKFVFEGLHNVAHDCYTIGIPMPGCLLLSCIADPGMIKQTSREYIDVCLDFSAGEGKTLLADTNLIDRFNVQMIRKADRSAFEMYMQEKLT